MVLRVRHAKGETEQTGTSQYLIKEATYPMLISDEIDDRTRKTDSLIAGLFLPKRDLRVEAAQVAEAAAAEAAVAPDVVSGEDRAVGTILNLKEGCGFIKCEGVPNNLFFFHSNVLNRDFNDLSLGIPCAS